MDDCRLFRFIVLWSIAVGTQDRQCPDGLYGSSCQHTCPVSCNSKLCGFDELGRTNCTRGCVDGYRGTSCRIPCPVNCQVCERLNGSCTKCNDTFHGTNCTLTCEELCQGFQCDTDLTCSKTTCLDGRYGQNCSNKCYPRYLTCARSTGDCTACGDGYHGQFCELDCPPCGFTRGSMDQMCKDGCKTIPCSDLTHCDSLNNIQLYSWFIPVVLLLAITIAVILLLWWRLPNLCRKKRTAGEDNKKAVTYETIDWKKKAADGEVQQSTLYENINNEGSNAAQYKFMPSPVETGTDSDEDSNAALYEPLRSPVETDTDSKKKKVADGEVQQSTLYENINKTQVPATPFTDLNKPCDDDGDT